MRLGIALSFGGMLVWGCGSPSGGALFGHGAVTGCTAAVACTGPADCVGHEACGADGKLGACTCDAVNQHDEAGVSTGGTTSSSGGSSASVIDSGSGAAGSGGVPPVDSGLTKVVDSGSPVTCPVGSYTGKLSGIYKSTGGFTQAEIGATISFSVDSTGAVTGTYVGPSAAKATLSGNVDCRTGAINMQVENGTYAVTVAFSGTLTGTYDTVGDRFRDGHWTLTESANPLDGGQGTWNET